MALPVRKKAVSTWFDKEKYVLRFRAPKQINNNMEYYREIAIHAMDGPRNDNNNKWMIDVLYHGEIHSDNIYDEPIDHVLGQILLIDLHEYVIYNMYKWSLLFRKYIRSTFKIYNNIKYALNNIVFEDNKYFKLSFIANGDQICNTL